MTPTRRTAVFYNRLSLLYPLIDVFFRKQKAALRQRLAILQPTDLLDLGAGNGSNFSLYAPHRITAVELSPTMLAKARLRALEDSQLILADAHFIPFGDHSFGVVVLSHVLATVENPKQVLTEAARVLHPGGRLFILNHFTPRGPLRWIDHLFQPVGRLLHFRSVFYEADLPLSPTFRTVSSQTFFSGYFKLLEYQLEA